MISNWFILHEIEDSVSYVITSTKNEEEIRVPICAFESDSIENLDLKIQMKCLEFVEFVIERYKSGDVDVSVDDQNDGLHLYMSSPIYEGGIVSRRVGMLHYADPKNGRSSTVEQEMVNVPRLV